jgi:histidinol-phosphate phosphatase family protein
VKKKAAVLIDRDGVINKDLGVYVRNFKEFKFLPHAVKALALLTKKKMPSAVISNQAGVGKGLMTARDLGKLTRAMRAHLRKKGARVNGVFYCTHAPDEGCHCRKPNTGLFMRAQRRLGLDLKKCYYIGDDARDVQAAANAGCTMIVVLSGKLRRRDLASLRPKGFIVKKNLYDAVRWILARERKNHEAVS